MSTRNRSREATSAAPAVPLPCLMPCQSGDSRDKTGDTSTAPTKSSSQVNGRIGRLQGTSETSSQCPPPFSAGSGFECHVAAALGPDFRFGVSLTHRHVDAARAPSRSADAGGTGLLIFVAFVRDSHRPSEPARPRGRRRPPDSRAGPPASTRQGPGRRTPARPRTRDTVRLQAFRASEPCQRSPRKAARTSATKRSGSSQAAK